MSKLAPKHDRDWLQQSRQYWDALAATFDEEPDHGLRDPFVREAWTAVLQAWLPKHPARIVDLGCGTGSLSVVLAQLGHTVTAIDVSPAMISQAEAKAATHQLHIDFQVMNAASPLLAQHQFDVIICRHLLWALPEPQQVLQRWAELLQPHGRCLLIEGYWNTNAGLHSGEITEMLLASFTNITVQNLSDNSRLWGGEATDERYAIIADLE
jgi:2-polyprenyl-3-methyl-5-hydroxy-6-metoxy-1,4-benzoquinol methylase